MKTFDLRKIRRALDFGDIQKIADNSGVAARVVSETLNRGWHPDLRNEIIAAALNVIRGKGLNPELIKEADEMKLTAETYTTAGRRPHNKFKKGNKYGGKRSKPGGVWKIVAGLGVGVVLFWFLVGKKLFGKTQ